MSFAATRYEASEDDEALEFLVSLSTTSSQVVTVEYATASGTATAGDDYTSAIGTLTFPAGTTEQTIRVSIIDDNVEEEEEAFTVTLSNSNATIGDGEATGVILDNDEPDEVVTKTDTEVVTKTDTDIVTKTDTDVVKSEVMVSFAATRYEASEDDEVLRFAVQLSTESRQEVTVEYATASGTATAGDDYNATHGTLTFPASTTSRTIRVPIIDDDVVEEEETFRVLLRNSNATIGAGKATGVIADNDILAEVNIAADPTAVSEGETAAFTLTRVGNLTAPLTVPVSVTESGAFLADKVPTEATFAANAATATLLVATDDDGRIEADGAVTATIMDGPHQIGDAASATVAIIDNDVRGVTVTPTALMIPEGESDSYTVVLNTEPTADVTVAVQVPEGPEISVFPTALTFTANNWNTPQTVTVTAAQDDDSVPDNPVTIRHAVSGGDYGTVTAASVVVTILEDDPPTIQIADAAAVEGDGEMEFSVRLSLASIQTVTVEYATADGSATAGTDYEETTGTLTFFALQTEQTIRVPILDDDLDEEPEAFAIALSGAENSTITDGKATGVILDNDLPAVSVAADPAGVIEGDTVSFTLTRVGNLTAPLTVPVRVTESDAFLTDEVPTEATFAANAATTTLLMATDDDERDEADGTVTATITSGATYQIGDAGSATVLVIDNDVPGVTITPTVLALPEGASVSYTVVLDTEPTGNVTVAVQVPEDTEVAVDETALMFTAESWNQAQTITVSTAHDDDAVADEPVTIRHAVSGGDYDTVTAESVTVIIIEDDMPEVSITDGTATEGDEEMAFQVRLNVASSQTVTVEYATTDSTATADEDYERKASMLTFSALETEQTIRVPIIDDDLDEALEVFTVMLSNASNATIKDDKATGVIADNDLPVVGVAADPTAVEEGETVTFVLARIGDLTAPLTVPVSVTERSAFLADGAPTEATFATNEAIITLPVATVDDDVDEVNGLVTATIADGVTHRAGESDSATVPVADNDVRGATVTPTKLTVDEGDSASYTVVLASEPTANVTVAVQVPEDVEVTVDETALTFTAENWNQAQTVTVSTAQDADAVADEPVTIRHAVSGGDYDAVAADSVEVTIIEDDTPRLLIANAVAAEGDEEMAFAVRLSVLSSQTVTVDWMTGDGTATAGTDYEAATGTLTFSALETQQTIRVPIIDDDLDEAAETFTVALSNASNATVGDGEATSVIVDNDLPVVSVAADPTAVEEGETVTFTLTRVGDLTVPLTVLVKVTERGAFLAAGTPTEATFAVGVSNATLQVATVDDDVDEVNGLVTATLADGVTHRAGESDSATVPVADNDVRGATVTPTELTVDEGGSANYTVVLTSEPTADVTIAIQVPDSVDITADQTELTFTANNWNTPQTVTVSAAQDADAVADEPVTLTHTVSGGDYENATAANVEVTTTEDDTPSVTISSTALEVQEGDTGRYMVMLDTEPTADVTVAIQVPDNVDITADQTELIFTTDNWNTPQTVTVIVAHDDDAVADEPVGLTHTVSGGDYEGVTAANVEVTITEDDTPSVTISSTALEVQEGDEETYTAVLDTEPTADVTIAIQVPDNVDITADQTELIFTTDNWNTPQTVTVIVAHDDDAVADEPVTLTHTVSGGDYEGVTAAQVEVTITEDDTPSVTISSTALEVQEGGEGTYTVMLDTEPTANVTIAIQVPDNVDITADQTELTFTTDNWNTPQTVTIAAAHDDDAVADEPVGLTHTVSGGDYEGVTAANVEVTITEDDTPSVTISSTALEVQEGDEETYTAVLDTEPTADVTIAIQVPDNVDITVDQTELIFTTDNWNTPQTVTVSAAQDDDAVADEPVTLTHTVSGGDYEDVTAANVEVTITEDDTPGVTISTTALEVSEGDEEIYTVVLDTEPTADVTIAIQVPDSVDITIDQTELTFTADNWNTPQTVTVSAAQDADAVADEPVTLTHTVSGGDYEGVTAAQVEVTITEDDTPSVTISITALEVQEGGEETYTAVLDTEPTADVIVAVQVPDNMDITVAPTALIFTTDNWNTSQTVTVTAAHDDDAVADDSVVLTHTVSGGDYEGLAAADVEVTITEDDTPGVTISVTALTVPEGDEEIYTVVLDTEPAADVTVAIQMPENAEVSVAPATLTFTAANWNETQTFAVTAAHDDDAVADEPVVLTHTVSGGDYEGLAAANVEVTITEDDTPALTIADASATESDGEITFTVRLNVASSLEVTVDWTTADGTATKGTDYAETTGTLSFDALETEQTITVPLLDDDLDEADETFTIALSNPANATLDEAEATGTIADNDAAPALTIADAEAAEGDREISFAVTIGAVSSFAITVDWTTADGTATADADYTAAEGSLTFAPGQTEATIAVVVFNDALDEGDETFTIALSNLTNATIANDTATGTITDDDPSVEKAWLARFGRTAASQIMDAISNRLTDRSGGGAHLTVGGQRVTLAAMSERGQGPIDPPKNSSLSDVLSQHPFYSLTRSSFADIISRSSFQLSAATDEERDGRWTAWGRGATTRFRSEEADLSLIGGPVTALLGVDRQQGRMLAGLAVAHSLGTGEFDVHTAEEAFRKGELGTYLTSVHPYLRVAVTERLSTWGLLGYGRGQMERIGDRPDTDIGMKMGGLGTRGTLLSSTESSDFDVALKSDAFLVQTDADAAVQPALETMTSRLRLLLEGGRPVELDSGRMRPSLEVGMRHDGGDAETGLGLEVGGSLGYTHLQRGVALQATARRLLVHQATGYEEWGVGGSLNIDPGALGRGPSLRMHSSWGTATSGMNRLWSQRSAADLTQSTQATEAGLFDAELGYGLDALGGLLTPYARIASGRDTHTYGVGGRLRVEQSLRVDLVAEHRERTTAWSSHEFKLRSTLYW